MKKLSIVIPVYNVEKYLSKCLDSVLNFQSEHLEIIAVNDGSTDSSPNILNKYAAEHKVLRVISTKNGGLGAARDVGINAASGEYIIFLDSDDYFAPNSIPEILEKCKEVFDICFFDVMSVNEHGKMLRYDKGSNRTGYFSFEENPQILFRLPSTWNKIYRRSLFTENNIYFPSRVWFEDIRTIPKLYIYAKRMTYEPKAWYQYLQRSGSITNSSNAARNTEIIEAVDDLLSFYKGKGLFEKYRPELEYMIYYNEFLTSTDRVNLIDKNSIVQDEIMMYYLENFPDYKDNKYFKKMPLKFYFLDYLIFHRHRSVLNKVLKLNNVIKFKNL